MKGNLIKKTAAFIMALCILSGGLPQTTGKVSLTKFNLTADAADSTVSFDEERGTLILSGNVNKDDVIAYADNEKVKTVYCKQGTVFPEDCSEMFQYFRATDFDLHDADTSKVTDMNYMFNCSCAELITLTGWDTSKVTNMNYMFCDCSGLQFIFVNDKWKINDKNKELPDISHIFMNMANGNTIAERVTKISHPYAPALSAARVNLFHQVKKSSTNGASGQLPRSQQLPRPA